MGIEDANGNSIITLRMVEAMLFRFALWVGGPITAAIAISLWSTTETVKRHDWDLVHQDTRLLRLEARAGLTMAVPSAPANVNQTVAINTEKPEGPPSAKGYLTTNQVADREGVTPRTVINWIEERRIIPPPMKADGKSYAISPDYRFAENCGEFPPIAEPAETR